MGNYTHMISRYSSEDPLFYMLHTWLDYVFVAWKQCHGYDQIDASELDTHPRAYFAYPPESENLFIPRSELDDKLYYVPMDDIEWFEQEIYSPTARTMYAEDAWNIQYERGTFLARSHLNRMCDHPFDNEIIVQNSDETLAMIKQLRMDETMTSEVDAYEHATWKYLDKLMDADSENVYSKKEYLQTWQAKTCNFQRQRVGKQACYLPIEYEQCSDEDYARRHELSMDELLNKQGVAGNDCLEEVRFNNYAWAKSIGKLFELCNGELDEYFVCDPTDLNIEFMIELDDDTYYRKLMANKQQMMREQEANANEDLEWRADDVVIGDIDMIHYSDFVMFRYLMIAFVMGGIAFFVMLNQCCNEWNTKLKLTSRSEDGHGHGLYGSVISGSIEIL